MDKSASSIQGLGRAAFVEEQDAAFEERAIPSGRGRIEARSRGAKPLEPEILCAEDGRLGWRVRLPRGLPLATPAVMGDRVFVGGGFGSHEVYSFDAGSGALRWQIRTGDDGPTAAVAEGERVAFNTESCTVYVIDAVTGKEIWHEWLGDPLMAQPAIGASMVFMAYPDQRHRHHIAAFDLEGGRKRWETEIIADLITAPVVAGDAVYAVTLDGTLYQVDRETGEKRWSLAGRATSAPWIHRGKIYVSLREEGDDRGGGPRGRVFEGHATANLSDLLAGLGRTFSRRKAEYLKENESEPVQEYYAKQDAGVGFASAPAAAKIPLSAKHLGLGRVSSVWSYQGSRPEVFDDGIFSTLDDVVQRLDLETRKPIWRGRLAHCEKAPLGRVLSPPAVTTERLYLTSASGDLIALDRSSGRAEWALNVGSPILSQPAVAGGRVFFGTADGALYAFDAGDADLRGWPMWGGGAGHNGAEC